MGRVTAAENASDKKRLNQLCRELKTRYRAQIEFKKKFIQDDAASGYYVVLSNAPKINGKIVRLQVWLDRFVNEESPRRIFYIGFEADTKRDIESLIELYPHSKHQRNLGEEEFKDLKRDTYLTTPLKNCSKPICEHFSDSPYYFGIYDLQSGQTGKYSTSLYYRFLDAMLPKLAAVNDDIGRDIKQINKRKTERIAMIMARIGQGKFRKDVEEVYGRKCAVTGCEIPELLRASHIKPWSKSNDKEKLDPYNGLLLEANLDALFDKCLISFFSKRWPHAGFQEIIGRIFNERAESIRNFHDEKTYP